MLEYDPGRQSGCHWADPNGSLASYSISLLALPKMDHSDSEALLCMACLNDEDLIHPSGNRKLPENATTRVRTTVEYRL